MRVRYFAIIGTGSEATIGPVYPTLRWEDDGSEWALDATCDLFPMSAVAEANILPSTTLIEVRLSGISNGSHAYDATFDGISSFVVLGWFTVVLGSTNSSTRFIGGTEWVPARPTHISGLSRGGWTLTFFNLATNAEVITNRIAASATVLRLRSLREYQPNSRQPRIDSMRRSRFYQLRSSDRVTIENATTNTMSFRLNDIPNPPGLVAVSFTFAGTVQTTATLFTGILWCFGLSITNYETLFSPLSTAFVPTNRVLGFGGIGVNPVVVAADNCLNPPGTVVQQSPRVGNLMLGAGTASLGGFYAARTRFICNEVPTQISFVKTNINGGSISLMPTGFAATMKVTPYQDGDELMPEFEEDNIDNFIVYAT